MAPAQAALLLRTSPLSLLAVLDQVAIWARSEARRILTSSLAMKRSLHLLVQVGSLDLSRGDMWLTC